MCINFYEFLGYLFDDDGLAQKGATIVNALLEDQSPRLSNIAEKMAGESASCYKAIQRFQSKVDLKQILLRFYQEEAEFVIGDPTEMERYKAPKTLYVDKLSDDETPGYFLFVLSTPFRGRAIPFWFVTYFSETIREQATSRNPEHFRCFEVVKDRLHAPAARLSTGQRQRLCLARGLAIEPQILLGDEATSALDPISAQYIVKRLLDLKKDNTIVMVTHNLRQAKRLADYVIFMYLGEVIEHGPAEEVFNNPREARTRTYLHGEF